MITFEIKTFIIFVLLMLLLMTSVIAYMLWTIRSAGPPVIVQQSPRSDSMGCGFMLTTFIIMMFIVWIIIRFGGGS